MSSNPIMAYTRHGRSFDTRVEGNGDNGGYILGMYNGHSLIASYSSPNFFSSYFGGLESLVLSFLFEYTNQSFH